MLVVTCVTSAAIPKTAGVRYVPSIAEVSSAAAPAAPVPLLQAVASLAVGEDPEPPLYDPVDGNLYVVNTGSSNVSVVQGLNVTASIGVGANPSCAAVDPRSGDVYVCTNGTGGPSSSTGLLSVLSGKASIATVSTGGCPTGLARDERNGYLYVADECSSPVGGTSGNVTVVSGTSVVATVNLPGNRCPDSAAYDPADGYVYVGDCAGNLSVINGTTYLTTLGTGYGGPSGWTQAAFDSSTGVLYAVGGPQGTNVVLVNGTTIVSSVPLPFGRLTVGLGPLSYDDGNGFVYVPSFGGQAPYGNISFFPGYNNVTVLNGSTPLTTIAAGYAYGSARPFYAPYGNGTGYLFSSNCTPTSAALVAVGGTSIAGSLNLSACPGGGAYDPVNADVYVPLSPSGGTGTVQVVTCASCNVVTVAESGASSGASWAITASEPATSYAETTAAVAPAVVTLRLVAGTYRVHLVGSPGLAIRATSDNAVYSVAAGTLTVSSVPPGPGPSPAPGSGHPVAVWETEALAALVAGVIIALLVVGRSRRLRRQGRELVQGMQRALREEAGTVDRGR